VVHQLGHRLNTASWGGLVEIISLKPSIEQIKSELSLVAFEQSASAMDSICVFGELLSILEL